MLKTLLGLLAVLALAASPALAQTSGPNPVTPDGYLDSSTFSPPSVTSATTIVTLNTQGFGYIEFAVTSAGSGNQIVVESSSDGVAGVGNTFSPISFWRPTTASDPPAVSQNVSAVTYVAPVSGQTMRIRVSSYTSGAVTIFGALKRGPAPFPGGMNTNTAGSLSGDGVLASTVNVVPSSTGTSRLTGSLPYLYNGSTADRARSANAVDGTGTGVQAVEMGGQSFGHINTNATTTVVSGAHTLTAVCVNTKGASANTATIYNNTAASGTVVGIVDTTTQIGCLQYNAYLNLGITVVTATGTAPDLTVTYR